MMTKHQATLIVALIRTVRPDWDERNTLNTLAALRNRDLADIAAACIRAAADPDAKTPRALTFTDRPWWQHSSKQAAIGTPRAEDTCPIDGHSSWRNNCSQCRADTIARKDPTP